MKNVYMAMQGLKPDILMVMVQVGLASTNILFKLAINDGMSMRVATAYRLLFASAFTVPVALISDRKKRPKITLRVLGLGFLCGMFGGSLYLNLYLLALALTSATFMLAMVNLIPAITFIMALASRLEKLNLGAREGKAKVMGTIIGIGGAMLLTFFKGVELHLWDPKINVMHPHHHHTVHHMSDLRSKLLGVPCAFASCCAFALWFIIQAKLNVEYPSHNSSAALVSTMGAIQATVLALCVERDWSQWKLDFGLRLLTVSYSGMVVSGLMTAVIAWCIKQRGPLFASVFNPLQLLLVAIAAYLVLDEKLYLGCVIGAVLIVIGLYLVLWGKAKELKNKNQLVPLGITSKEPQNVEVVVTKPLDQNKSVQSQQNQNENVGNQ